MPPCLVPMRPQSSVHHKVWLPMIRHIIVFTILLYYITFDEPQRVEPLNFAELPAIVLTLQ